MIPRCWSAIVFGMLLVVAAFVAAQGEAPQQRAAPAGRNTQLLEHEPGQFIRSITFFADGKRLATRGWDGNSIWIHDLATGKKTIRLHSRSSAERPPLTISADGKLLVEGPSVWDLATRNEVFGLSEDSEDGCSAISPDGRVLAQANANGLVRLLDVKTGKQRLQFQSPQRHISIVVFTPDGTVLASMGYVDKTVRNAICLWDAATGKLLRRLEGFRGTVEAVVFSPDGSLLAEAGEVGPVRLFETATGKQLRECEGLDGMIQSVSFSADGRALATAGGYMKWQVHLLEVATGKEIRVLRTYDRDNVSGYVAFAPDGPKLVMADRGVRVLTGDAIDLAVGDDRPAVDLGPKELEKLWADLGGNVPHAGKAYRAMWALGAGPEKSVPFLQQRLRPVPSVDEAKLNRLIADLDSDRFEARHKATQELEGLLNVAERQLRQVLTRNPSLELRSRVERLLARVESQAWSAQELQVLRALQVLEHIGTPEARRVVETLAKGAEGVRRTVEARASLGRMAR